MHASQFDERGMDNCSTIASGMTLIDSGKVMWNALTNLPPMSVVGDDNWITGLINIQLSTAKARLVVRDPRKGGNLSPVSSKSTSLIALILSRKDPDVPGMVRLSVRLKVISSRVVVPRV